MASWHASNCEQLEAFASFGGHLTFQNQVLIKHQPTVYNALGKSDVNLRRFIRRLSTWVSWL